MPDLFGYVAPASVKPSTNTDPTSGRTGPLASPAPDRPAARSASGIPGVYERSGAGLRRGDGRVLLIRWTVRGATARRGARYVETAAKGEPVAYLGSLYDDDATGRCDLDGTQFQDRRDRTRYRIAQAGADLYRVEPISRRGGTFA